MNGNRFKETSTRIPYNPNEKPKDMQTLCQQIRDQLMAPDDDEPNNSWDGRKRRHKTRQIQLDDHTQFYLLALINGLNRMLDNLTVCPNESNIFHVLKEIVSINAVYQKNGSNQGRDFQELNTFITAFENFYSNYDPKNKDLQLSIVQMLGNFRYYVYNFIKSNKLPYVKSPSEANVEKIEEDSECAIESELQKEQKCKCNMMENKCRNDNDYDSNAFEEGWKTGVEKYKSEELFKTTSPVKQIEAVLRSQTFKTDLRFQGFVWVLSMTEQFYYDNTLILVSKNRKNKEALKNSLNLNFAHRDAKVLYNDWINVVPLGSGMFGDVIKVHDKQQNVDLAIKILKKSNNQRLLDNIRTLMSYFVERNYMIKARESPYVIKFFQSLTIPKISGLFLVFEYCLCNLTNFLYLLAYDNTINFSTSMWEQKEQDKNIVLKNLASLSEKVGIELFPIIMIHIFEMFSTLDYLAKCNIVHNDIKPENIMIGENLHLKLGDFGLVFNQDFVTAESNKTLLDHTKLGNIDIKNDTVQVHGTASYMDIEELIGKYKDDMEMFLFFVKSHPDLRSWVHGRAGDFMSDTWAMGLISTELLLCNTRIFYHIDEKILREMGLPNWPQGIMFLPIFVTLLYNNYDRYIDKGLRAIGGPQLDSLMKFFAQIFMPRHMRLYDMRLLMSSRKYSKVNPEYYIDIRKVEELDIFKELNINATNVFMYPIDKEFKHKLLPKEKPPKFANFGQYVDNLEKKNLDQENFLPMEPGIGFFL